MVVFNGILQDPYRVSQLPISNRHSFRGNKQLLLMSAMALLTAALVHALFPFSFKFLKGSINSKEADRIFGNFDANL